MTLSQDAPDVTQLWDRLHVARKPGKLCACCKAPIEVGEKYQTTGMICDGEFQIFMRHLYGEHYPSGCPALRARDLAELAIEAERYP